MRIAIMSPSVLIAADRLVVRRGLGRRLTISRRAAETQRANLLRIRGLLEL